MAPEVAHRRRPPAWQPNRGASQHQTLMSVGAARTPRLHSARVGSESPDATERRINAGTSRLPLLTPTRMPVVVAQSSGYAGPASESVPDVKPGMEPGVHSITLT